MKRSYRAEEFEKGVLSGIFQLMELLYINQNELHLNVEDIGEMLRKKHGIISLDKMKFDILLSDNLQSTRQQMREAFNPVTFRQSAPQVANEKEYQLARWDALLEETRGILLLDEKGQRRTSQEYQDWTLFFDDLRCGNLDAYAILQDIMKEDPRAETAFNSFEKVYIEFTEEERFCAKTQRLDVKIEDMNKAFQNELIQAASETKSFLQQIEFKADWLTKEEKESIINPLSKYFAKQQVVIEKNTFESKENLKQFLQQLKETNSTAGEIVNILKEKNKLQTLLPAVIALGCTIGLTINIISLGKGVLLAHRLPILVIEVVVMLVCIGIHVHFRSKLRKNQYDEKLNHLIDKIPKH